MRWVTANPPMTLIMAKITAKKPITPTSGESLHELWPAMMSARDLRLGLELNF